MFVPIEEKLKKINPTADEFDEFEHYKSILPKMIANGHAAHQTIPGYETCKPEIEAFRWFDGINIPVHGYIDLKGDKDLDKCKFPRKGKIKKMALGLGLPQSYLKTNLNLTTFYK